MELSTGRVVYVADNIVKVSGIADTFVGELINIGSRFGAMNVAFGMNMENSYMKLVLCQGNQTTIRINDPVYRTNRSLVCKAGFDLLGAVVTPLGVILNDEDFSIGDIALNEITFSGFVDMFSRSPTIIDRACVTRPFLTGVTVIDCFIPIGCGQRELIIGDNNSGKTSLALTAILNQRHIVNGYYKI